MLQREYPNLIWKLIHVLSDWSCNRMNLESFFVPLSLSFLFSSCSLVLFSASRFRSSLSLSFLFCSRFLVLFSASRFRSSLSLSLSFPFCSRSFVLFSASRFHFSLIYFSLFRVFSSSSHYPLRIETSEVGLARNF